MQVTSHTLYMLEAERAKAQESIVLEVYDGTNHTDLET